MSAEKRTRVEKEEALSSKDRENLFWTGWELYIKKDYENAINFLIKAYDMRSTPCDTNAKAAWFIALYTAEFQDIKDSIEWFEVAVENGSSRAAFELAQLYEEGLKNYDNPDGSDEMLIEPCEYTALSYFEEAAKLGDTVAMIRCSEYFRNGLGTIRNYERAFHWLLKAACNGQEHCTQLSQCFLDGIIVEENVYEAYIWAIIAQNHCSEEWVLELEGILDKKKIIPAQKEAQKRFNLSGFFSLSPELLFEYMINEVLSNKDKPKEKTKPKTPPNPALAPLEEEDLEPSLGVEYKYLRNCKKGFNPEKVKIELVVNVKAKKTEEMDFDSIKITYNGKHTDKKLRDVLYKKGINYKQRRLLLALAAQFSEPDDEQRFLNIRKIVQAPDMKTCVSNLNAMFRAIFPGCEKNGSFSMIDRKNGRLFPQLKVDTTKIINARNYDYWRNI